VASLADALALMADPNASRPLGASIADAAMQTSRLLGARMLLGERARRAAGPSLAVQSDVADPAFRWNVSAVSSSFSGQSCLSEGAGPRAPPLTPAPGPALSAASPLQIATAFYAQSPFEPQPSIRLASGVASVEVFAGGALLSLHNLSSPLVVTAQGVHGNASRPFACGAFANGSWSAQGCTAAVTGSTLT
jgi:hypothetical protein